MHKPQSIQIIVDNPCHQNWDDMTVAGSGRFCNQCQKTVIDFTSWSDAVLYQFFAKNPTNVCGRFLNTQLGVPIAIPYQPHSRLYRITIALGLTLICTQTPVLLAQNRPPKAVHVPAIGDTKDTNSVNPGYGLIRGNVVDEKKEPLVSATIQVYQAGILKGGNVTDYDGNYMIKPLEAGIYDVTIFFADYDSVVRKNVLVKAGEEAVENVAFAKPLSSWNHKNYVVMGGMRSPLVNRRPDIPSVAEIYGHVKDEDGRYLPQAEVQVYKDDQLIKKRMTNSNGDYDITKLEPGLYDLKIVCEQYDLFTMHNVQIKAGKSMQDIAVTGRRKRQ